MKYFIYELVYNRPLHALVASYECDPSSGTSLQGSYRDSRIIRKCRSRKEKRAGLHFYADRFLFEDEQEEQDSLKGKTFNDIEKEFEEFLVNFS